MPDQPRLCVRVARSGGRNVRTLAAAVALALNGASLADPGKDAAARGNAFFEQRQFDQASLAYQLAKEKGYATPQVEFNLARTHAELGELDQAAARFRAIAADPRAASLRRDARFNLGAIEYRKAKSAAGSNPSGALDLLRRAEQSFRAVVEQDAGDHQAARNVEQIQREIKLLQDALDQQKQQQRQQQQTDGSKPGGKPGQSSGQAGNQSDPNSSQDPGEPPQQPPGDENRPDQSNPTAGDKQDPPKPQEKNEDRGQAQPSAAEQLSDLARQQSDLAKQSDRLAEDQKQAREQGIAPKSKQELDQRAKDLQQKQESLSKQTEEAAKRMNETNAAPPSNGSKQEPSAPEKTRQHAADRARQAQAQAEQQLSHGDASRAAEHQRQAARDLARAAGLQAQEPSEPTAMTDSPVADLDAAKILDKERKEANQRLMRLLRTRSGKPAAPGKDW